MGMDGGEVAQVGADPRARYQDDERSKRGSQVYTVLENIDDSLRGLQTRLESTEATINEHEQVIASVLNPPDVEPGGITEKSVPEDTPVESALAARLRDVLAHIQSHIRYAEANRDRLSSITRRVDV